MAGTPVIGITSYGAYVPPTRLPFAVIAGRRAVDGAPEKAVAWNDEDSVTMAVEAAVNCLRGFDRAGVDAVMFASTTYATPMHLWVRVHHWGFQLLESC